MAWRGQEPVTFEDVAIYLSRAEWDALEEGQRELYRSVMLDNYELLSSLGYPGPKPDVLHRLEHGEEPWVCMPPSPLSWDGPHSPSPGRQKNRRWLEEPSSSWWPGAGKQRVLEEGTETPREAGGRCVQWRLRSRRLLNKFRCLGDGNHLPAGVASRGAGPGESQARAQAAPCPGRSRAMEDGRGLTTNLTQSCRFPLHPGTAQQEEEEAGPGAGLPGGGGVGSRRRAPKSRRASSRRRGVPSAEELRESVRRDHCYCALGEGQLPCCARRCLTEHNYCRLREEEGPWPLKEHDYCHLRGTAGSGHRGRPTLGLAGAARCVLRRLAARKSRIGRLIRKARRILWHYKPWVNKKLDFPLGSPDTQHVCQPPFLSKAGDHPPEGSWQAFPSPASQEAASPQPRGEGRSRGATSEAFCPPGVSSEPVATSPPSEAAVEVKKEARHPEESVQGEVEPAQSPEAKGSVEGGEGLNPNYVSLHKAYRMVMRTVDHVLDSVCQNLELGGYSRCQDLWPLVVPIDG